MHVVETSIYELDFSYAPTYIFMLEHTQVEMAEE